MSLRRVEVISYLLGQDPKPNGSDFNWSGKTRDGKSISIYYETNRKEDQLDWVEFYDPSNYLGLPMDQNYIGGIKIMNLPKYFTRYGV